MTLAQRFAAALRWVDTRSLPGGGIAVSSKVARPYPEVSGYFIPTLLAWSERSRALAYGRWLTTVQHANGAWGDPDQNQPFAFDSGQILKGMLALAQATGDPQWEASLRRGCDWIVSLIGDDGVPRPPDLGPWGKEVPHAVLLYSLEAVKRAGEHLGEARYVDKVDQATRWFLAQPGLTDFSHLSHFHAYVLEALYDLGYPDRAAEGMAEAARRQRKSGAVPAYRNVRWVCSTGLFQYALVWYKLGHQRRGDEAFHYAASLQNRSGGWYGSYGWFRTYFPKAEISWAVKYFLDALQWKLRASFERMAPMFSESIARDDGRYLLVRDIVRERAPHGRVLDAGCGKGRYLRNLAEDVPGAELHGCDLSTAVMETIPAPIRTAQGSLLRLPYPDGHFDVAYTVEALEHAVHIEGALRELTRVLKPGGTLIIVDKDQRQLGRMALPEWERWFGTRDLSQKLEACGLRVTARENVPYEGRADGLFTAWIGQSASAAASGDARGQAGHG